MSLDNSAGTGAPAPLPLQYVSIELMPIIGGQLAVALKATFLDETDFEFVGQDLANTHVATLDEALAVIRQNVAVLASAITA